MHSSVTAVLLVLIVPITYFFVWKPRARSSKRVAAIIVLGDIGRSPRMMYHAESLAIGGWETYIIGYKGTAALHLNLNPMC